MQPNLDLFTITDALKSADITLNHITEIVTLDTCPSTNTALLNLEKDQSPSGTFLITAQQSAGRGRLERSWLMGEGDIACSLLLRPPLLPTPITLLSLMPAVAVAQALSQLGQQVFLKWPNDIVYKNPDSTAQHAYFGDCLKIGGILIENVIRDGQLMASIIGIGLNISPLPEHKKLVPHRGHLGELDPGLLRINLLVQLLKALDDHIKAFQAADYPVSLVAAYRERCVSLGRELVIENKGQKIVSIGRDIGPDGSLYLEKEGVGHTIYGGEVNFCT